MLQEIIGSCRSGAVRVLGALLLAGFAGCAQPPGQTGGLSPADTSEELKLAMVRDVFSRDDHIERALGISRTAPNFSAVKSGYAALFGDEVVGRWAVREVQASGSGDSGKARFVSQWSARLANGLGRLTDAQAMGFFDPLAAMMERLDEAQCRDYNAKSSGNSMQKMMRYMTASEIAQFFDVMRLAIRADLQGAPLRRALTRDDIAATVKALTPATPDKASGAPSCQDAAGVFRAVDRLQGEQRSSAITVLLVLTGMAAQRTAAQ